nr:MAG TPA: hypothetical protein [Caudoviricetes sp.]
MEVIENLKKLISNFIENRQFAKITTGVVLSVSPHGSNRKSKEID